MSKSGTILRKQVRQKAFDSIYSQRPPLPIEEVQNPYPVESREAAWFAKEYGRLRVNWFWFEDLLDVLGGRPDVPAEH